MPFLALIARLDGFAQVVLVKPRRHMKLLHFNYLGYIPHILTFSLQLDLVPLVANWILEQVNQDWCFPDNALKNPRGSPR